MPEISAEIGNIAMLFKTILLVAVRTGLILIPLILIGYELQTKRR